MITSLSYENPKRKFLFYINLFYKKVKLGCTVLKPVTAPASGSASPNLRLSSPASTAYSAPSWQQHLPSWQ